MTGILFIPGLNAADLADKATVDAALAAAIYWPSGTPELCGIEVPGLVFTLSASSEANPYPLALFGEGQAGALWRGTLPDTMFNAASGGGQPAIGAGVARLEDQSGNGLHLTQATSSLRPLRSQRPKTGVRNLINSTEDFTNAVWGKSNVSITPNDAPGSREGSLAARFDFTPAVNGLVGRLSYSITAGLPYTFSVWVKGTAGQTARIYIDTAGGTYHFAETPVTFTGDWQRVTVTLTNTTGNTSINAIVNSTAGATGKTFHAWGAQLEQASAVSDYQKVGANLRDVTEAGVETVSTLYFDGVDDVMSATITDGITGQVAVMGDGGMYVEDVTIAADGAFSIGGANGNWTGAAPGILRAVRGDGILPAPALLDLALREGSFTEDEIARLERYAIAKGGMGLLVPNGVERVVNGGFDADANWSHSLSTIGGGLLNFSGVNAQNAAYQGGVFSAGLYHRVSLEISGFVGGSLQIHAGTGGANAQSGNLAGNGTHVFICRPSAATLSFWGLGGGGFTGSVDNVSVQLLVPRETL